MKIDVFSILAAPVVVVRGGERRFTKILHIQLPIDRPSGWLVIILRTVIPIEIPQGRLNFNFGDLGEFGNFGIWGFGNCLRFANPVEATGILEDSRIGGDVV